MRSTARERGTGGEVRVRSSAHRWAPLVATAAFTVLVLLRAGTSPLDLLRYAGYIGGALLLPGTLVYRAMRGHPHTLVEDLAMGAAIGLVLELGGWAVFSALNLRALLWLWPLLIVAPFLAISTLRRHWRVHGYTRAPLGWSWSVAAVVCFFTAYLAAVFLDRNPILPPSEQTRQYLDLAYQLSLAGEAKHAIPPGLPQVAGEPLNYHWFAYVHMASTSLIGHIDLPVVALRLAIPALCAAAVVLTAVVGWRLSGRPYAGAAAAALFFAVGEFNFTNPVSLPFGTQATFVIWHGMSMIYAWVLVIALIGPLAAIVAKDSYPRAGAFALVALLSLGSSGAKGSSLPVVGLALGLTAVVLLVTQRRIPWGVLTAGVMTGAAQLFAIVVLYHFQTYGVSVKALTGLTSYWYGSDSAVIVAGVWVAFVLNMLLRLAGLGPLFWLTRGRVEPAKWLLLAGAVAGTVLYLVLSQPGSGNQYFLRTGFAFGVIGSGWGYALLVERARLARPTKAALGLAAGGFALLLVWAQLRFAQASTDWYGFGVVLPMLRWARLLAAVGLVAGVTWWLAGRRYPPMRGRGSVVAMTAILVAGAPGLVMDAVKSIQAPNGGPYVTIELPKSRVDAARFVRDHSSPGDILATNAHCVGYYGKLCDSRSFWLSAYSERSVLVEGWGFAPRNAAIGLTEFWDPALLTLNDSAFTAPSPVNLARLHDRYGVRWLVVDRAVGTESAELSQLAARVYDNGRVAVYRLGV